MPIRIMLLVRVFAPFAAGYFLSYLFRVVNAVIAPDLIADIGATPSELGVLTATYFLTFAAFQLPLGILLDRFGPRKVEAILLIIAAAGAYTFSQAESILGLIWGRALIGFGVSACLMAAFKAYTLWFSRERWPLVNGFQMAAGGLGALAATSPVEMLLNHTDWRGLFLGLSVLAVVIAFAILMLVPEKKSPQPTGAVQIRAQLRAVWDIVCNREFLRIAPLTISSQATFLAIQGLWAGPWLSNVAGLDREGVADTLFLVALSMVGGFIVMGSLAGRLSHRNIRVSTTAVAGMMIFMVFQLVLLCIEQHGVTLAWIGFGFFGTSGIVSYAALTQSFPVHLAGRVTTAMNLLVFVAAFAAQWLIGWLVGLLSPVAGELTSTAFFFAFGILFLCEIFSLIWYFRPKG